MDIQIPHIGFTEVKISFKGLISPMDALMPVVPDTPYHECVPMLIKTNVLGYIEYAPITCDSALKIAVTNIAIQWVSDNASNSAYNSQINWLMDA